MPTPSVCIFPSSLRILNSAFGFTAESYGCDTGDVKFGLTSAELSRKLASGPVVTMERDDRYEVHGTAREKALENINKQLAEWGITMPPATAVLFDFGLGRFMEIGETEFWVANEPDLGYCAKFLFVFAGQTCPYHHHIVKHGTFFVLKGRVLMKYGSEERVMEQGDVLAIPPGVGHSFTGITNALLLEASMPSTLHDNFFADHEIGQNGMI